MEAANHPRRDVLDGVLDRYRIEVNVRAGLTFARGLRTIHVTTADEVSRVAGDRDR